MTLQEVFDTIMNISYKPGWSFSAGINADTISLTIHAPTIDVITKKPIFVSSGYKWSKLELQELDERGVYWMIYQRILDLERHEVKEWLRIGDMRPFPPHMEAIS